MNLPNIASLYRRPKYREFPSCMYEYDKENDECLGVCPNQHFLRCSSYAKDLKRFKEKKSSAAEDLQFFENLIIIKEKGNGD